MKVGLFIPCYVDAFFPEVGVATLELLERLGVDVEYPLDQTCCGQPMANAGCHADAAPVEALFARNFAGFDCVVTPSGSCTHHVRDHLTAIPQTAEVDRLRRGTYELVEFLHDVLQVREFPWARFPHRVGIHIGCSTLRALRSASMSELQGAAWSKPHALLASIAGIEIVTPARPDECCGFGGTFSLKHPAISSAMAGDKADALKASGAETFLSADCGCMLNINHTLQKRKDAFQGKHLATFLLERTGRGEKR